MTEGQDEGEITPDELVEEKSGSSARTSTSRSRQRDPLIGEVLDGRYEIIRLIARGGMGRIYSAEQSALGRRVALKIMDLGYSEDLDPDFQKRFFLEASTCAQLSHPNTIRVFDYGADGEICYIAMELIEGRTLLQAIHDAAPFPATRVMHIARQICGSLSEAHRKGIIHRDLKPSNVLLTQHGEETDFAKVLDFGLVKLLREDAQEITRSGLFLGSPNYMSPEQIRATNVDQRSDLYSLGVILFMALTGRAPFKRNTSINVLLAQLEELPPMLSEVAPKTDASPALQWVVMNCLEKNANERFGSVDELNKALKACQREDRGEYDAPLHLRLEAGRLVESTVPPGIDPMGAHSLRRPVSASSQEATVDTGGPNSLPRPTFGYTPSIGSRVSGAEWGPSLPPQSPPNLNPPPTAEQRLALQEMQTPVTGSGGRSAAEQLCNKPPGKTKKRKRKPPPTFWEKNGVLTLSLVALLLAVAAVALLVDPTEDPDWDKNSEPEPATAKVMVPLKSEPVGASVLKDGTLLGVTPLELAMPADASWELTVIADGYEPQRLVVLSGEPPDHVTLTEASDSPPDLALPTTGTPPPSRQRSNARPKPSSRPPKPTAPPGDSDPKPAAAPAAEPARAARPEPATPKPAKPAKMRVDDVRDPWAD